MSTRTRRGRSAFTLVELLVVIAIIALLVSILLPSLNRARAQARQVKCASNMRAVGQGFSTWLASNRGLYPFAYWYPNNDEGLIDFSRLKGQDPLKRYGYVHWSYLVYGTGASREEAFQCPQMKNGGVPPTNPGPDRPEIWEAGQVDDRCND